MGFGLFAKLRARAAPSAPRAEGVTPRPWPVVDVASVVSEALDGADLPRAIAVERGHARHAAFAAADPAALREALRALLRASAAAMPAGGEIRVALRRAGPRVVVEVSDSGAPLAACDAIAEAQRWVEQCGARLSRASVPGLGNRSRVSLAPPAPPPIARASRPRSPFDPPHRGR